MTVLAVYHGGVEKEFAVEQVIPPERSGSVSPARLKLVVEIHNIIAEISGEEKPVALADFVVHLRVEVIEKNRCSFQILEQREEQIDIRSAARNHERSLVFHYRSFQHKPARNEPQSCRSVEFFHVSFNLPHIQHA